MVCFTILFLIDNTVFHAMGGQLSWDLTVTLNVLHTGNLTVNALSVCICQVCEDLDTGCDPSSSECPLLPAATDEECRRPEFSPLEHEARSHRRSFLARVIPVLPGSGTLQNTICQLLS